VKFSVVRKMKGARAVRGKAAMNQVAAHTMALPKAPRSHLKTVFIKLASGQDQVL
jgi:hypothetical protein